VIAVCGEALIDMTPAGDDFRPRAGGSPLNVAVGLGRLGLATTFLGRISTDPFGDTLVRHLEGNRVDTSLVVRGPELTTLAFVHSAGGGETYSFYAERSADRLLRVEDLPTSLEGVEALHFGSLSLALEPGATALRTLLEREADRRLISLDPNIRPALLPDRDIYRPLLERLVARASLVKVSDVDAGWIYPGEAAEDVVARWRALGAALVVVTRGPGGSWADNGSAVATAPAHTIPNVVDTIGAGDAFTSGLLAWLASHQRLQRQALLDLDGVELGDALRFAALVSALTCTRAGAEPPTLCEVSAAV
jgi:fructokinase